MKTYYRQRVFFVLAVVLFISIGCDPPSTKTQPVPPTPIPETEPEADKTDASAFRVIGPTSMDGAKTLALEVVDESKLSTMSDHPTPDEQASWKELEVPRWELLSIRRAGQAGEIAPLNDGKRYLVASPFPELWDARQQNPIRIYQDESWGTKNAVVSMAVSHDDRWFAATDQEGVLSLWETDTGTLIAKKAISKRNHVAVAISPNSEELLVAIENHPPCLLDAQTLAKKKELGQASSGKGRPHFLGTHLGAFVGQRSRIHDLNANTPVTQFPSEQLSLSSMVIAERLYFGNRSSYESWSASDRSQKIHWEGQKVYAIAKVDNRLAWISSDGALFLVELETGRILQCIDSSSSENAFIPSIAGLGWLADSKVLVVASSNGMIRLWGTKESGDKLGLKPLSIVAPSSTPRSGPPHLSQLRETIDLRQMPRLPRKGYENINDSFNQYYKTSESIPRCKRFYRHWLGLHGWKEVPTADSLTNELIFEKKEVSLAVRLKKMDDDTTEIIIGMAGHFDLRSLRKPEGLTMQSLEETQNSVSFTTPASRLEIETQLLRLFASEGWSFVFRSDVTGIQRYSDHFWLNFVRNGISVQASISPDLATPNTRRVRWTASPKNFWTPIPSGCDCVDLRGTDLLVETSLKLADAIATYDRMLADDGWRKFESRSRPDGFESRYFRGQLDLLLHFQKTAHDTVLVKQGIHRDDYFPWVDASIEAAAFPIIEPTDGVEFHRSEKWIEYSTRSTKEKISETYSNFFAPKGLRADLGARVDGASSLRFLNVKNTDVLTVLIRSEKELNIVRISGSAIQWNATIPSDPPQLMSFEEWLKCKMERPSLRHLDDYVREMKE